MSISNNVEKMSHTRWVTFGNPADKVVAERWDDVEKHETKRKKNDSYDGLREGRAGSSSDGIAQHHERCAG